MKHLLILTLLVLAALLFYRYGRSVYMPLVKKVKGSETLESITVKLEGEPAERIQKDLAGADFDRYPNDLILIGLKKEQRLQVYGRDEQGVRLIKEYPFTAMSGVLGPKLQEGDKQIPEGIYGVEYLNPNSSYHLSIKVGYPNAYDFSKSRFDDVSKMGGDIFIHGKAASIGCIAIGDIAIEEVFLLVAKAERSKIKVIISPQDFRRDSSAPSIESIDWEEELYNTISEELANYPI